MRKDRYNDLGSAIGAVFKIFFKIVWVLASALVLQAVRIIYRRHC